ncbi:MAG: LysR family transcriptional regulator [Saccharospirillaceae bacterium]|nr:LysR family transcriptional regulator [Pseudomonadales bacterium]NRB78895.1 LysR family transcriptional regulator [Saccharospirillaceae bacterium]
MPDLNDMMVFRTVVEQGSFTKAANSIGLPKSNISRKVSRLEEQLGVLLLQRTTRSLRLSEIGQIYYEHCVRIYEEMTNAQGCVEAMAAVPKGWIKMCASVTVGQALLATRLPEFYKAFPQVKVDLKLSNQRIDLIEEGFDLAIRVGPSPDSNLISKRLCSVNLHLYASNEYLTKYQAKKTLKIPADLSQHNCLFMSASAQKQRWQLTVDKQKRYVDINATFISDDFNVLLQMAVDHMGIALLPDYLCEKQLKEKKLVRVLNECVANSLDIYAVYASRKGVTPKLRVLLDYLGDSFDS